MRTDALDPFGTRLEKRFTRDEIKGMMIRSGLSHIRFGHSFFVQRSDSKKEFGALEVAVKQAAPDLG